MSIIKKKIATKAMVSLLACAMLLQGGAVMAAAPSMEEPVSTLIEERASGIVAGPWYGSSSVAYSNAIKEASTVTSTLLSIFAVFVPNAVAKEISTAAGALLRGIALFAPTSYVYGTMEKTYRECRYAVDNTFAYFETKYTISVNLHDDNGDRFVKTYVEYYQSQAPMILEPDFLS